MMAVATCTTDVFALQALRLDEQKLCFWCHLLAGAAGLRLFADSVRKLVA